MNTPIEDVIENSTSTVTGLGTPRTAPAQEKKCANQQTASIGILIAIMVAACWVAATQLAQETFMPGSFNAPFLFMYFSSSWLILLYPLHLAITVSCCKGENTIWQIFKENLLIYNPHGFKIAHFIGKTTLFSVLWAVTHYCYIRSLDPVLLTATDVTSLYATNFSFVYMLSWIILFEKFVALRIIAMIFAITGIVLFVYADGFGSPSMWGVVLAVVASASASIFKVLFKKFVGEISYGKLSLFMSMIGLWNIICLWPITLALALTGTETITDRVPWSYFTGAATMLFIYHLLTHYVQRLTEECVMGLAMVIGIPFCAVSDYIWKRRDFHAMKISAVVLITFSLVLLLIPDKYPEKIGKLCSKCVQEDIPQAPNDRRHQRERRIHTKV